MSIAAVSGGYRICTEIDDKVIMNDRFVKIIDSIGIIPNEVNLTISREGNATRDISRCLDTPLIIYAEISPFAKEKARPKIKKIVSKYKNRFDIDDLTPEALEKIRATWNHYWNAVDADEILQK